MQKHTTKRTHGHDGKDKMVIIASLWDTQGQDVREVGPAGSKQMFADKVRAFDDDVGEGKLTDLQGSKQYLAFVKESLGGAPDAHSVLEDENEDTQEDVKAGFRWYTRAVGDGGYRVLSVIPAVYGETEEKVAADPRAARARAIAAASPDDPIAQMLSAIVGGAGGGPMFGPDEDDDVSLAPLPGGLFDDLDDETGDED